MWRHKCWGARDGAVVRALASHQCGSGSNSGVEAICGLSLLLVLSFVPRDFSLGTLVSLSSKTNISKFQFDHEWGRWGTPLWMCYLQIIIYLFIYYLFVNRWELRRLKNGEMDALQKHSKVLQLQSETLIDGYYTFLFFKSPSLWFKSLLEFKKAFMKHFKIMACIYPATGNLTDNPELDTRWFPNSFQTCSNK